MPEEPVLDDAEGDVDVADSAAHYSMPVGWVVLAGGDRRLSSSFSYQWPSQVSLSNELGSPETHADVKQLIHHGNLAENPKYHWNNCCHDYAGLRRSMPIAIKACAHTAHLSTLPTLLIPFALPLDLPLGSLTNFTDNNSSFNPSTCFGNKMLDLKYQSRSEPWESVISQVKVGKVIKSHFHCIAQALDFSSVVEANGTSTLEYRKPAQPRSAEYLHRKRQREWNLGYLKSPMRKGSSGGPESVLDHEGWWRIHGVLFKSSTGHLTKFLPYNPARPKHNQWNLANTLANMDGWSNSKMFHLVLRLPIHVYGPPVYPILPQDAALIPVMDTVRDKRFGAFWCSPRGPVVGCIVDDVGKSKISHYYLESARSACRSENRTRIIMEGRTVKLVNEMWLTFLVIGPGNPPLRFMFGEDRLNIFKEILFHSCSETCFCLINYVCFVTGLIGARRPVGATPNAWVPLYEEWDERTRRAKKADTTGMSLKSLPPVSRGITSSRAPGGLKCVKYISTSSDFSGFLPKSETASQNGPFVMAASRAANSQVRFGILANLEPEPEVQVRKVQFGVRRNPWEQARYRRICRLMPSTSIGKTKTVWKGKNRHGIHHGQLIKVGIQLCPLPVSSDANLCVLSKILRGYHGPRDTRQPAARPVPMIADATTTIPALEKLNALKGLGAEPIAVFSTNQTRTGKRTLRDGGETLDGQIVERHSAKG
ncbi:hypothetical protein FB45DRAFT_878757 [Roridomyces roridus]|uniref:Uncharacterized protein n=1 Tax=Roridomyces roridus TaxID=1738132 RepID=A0AAD7B019_9AGAR|nr:hypothetical protein FB45DRAFT_878757 [Roridomyces roridus]